MGRTKLFQEPGSPLIQGHSRTHHKFITDVVIASVLGLTLSALYGSTTLLYHAGFAVRLSEVVALVADGGPRFALLAVVAVIPASLGVWIARGMGWRRPWVLGAVGFMLIAIGMG